MLAKPYAAALVVCPGLVFGLVVIGFPGAGRLPRVKDDIVCIRVKAARFVKVEPDNQPLELRIAKVVLCAVWVIVEPIPRQLAYLRVDS